MAGHDRRPTNALIRVPHVQQTDSWDCGLACAQMVLRFLGVNIDDFQSVCSKLDFGKSVWTIDIASILGHYKVSHLYTTITLGVDKGYRDKSYYMANFSQDENRVTGLFASPSILGISINKCEVDLEDIKRHLGSENVAILLVDWSRLDCTDCDVKPEVQHLSGGVTCLFPYQGHYIVAVGYDDDNHLIYYTNPSYIEQLCCCSENTFEEARKRHGTDQDVIFVYKGETANVQLSTQDEPFVT